MLDTSDKIKFWDRRILAWENRHYKSRFSAISQRQKLAFLQLKDKVDGLHVLELGCGSSLLAKSLVSSGALSYTGIDLSPVAIQNAQDLNSGVPNCRFIKGDLQAASLEKFDLVFSLGLMDWLDESEQLKLSQLSQLSENKLFLHSFTEKILFTSIFNFIHRVYSNTYAQPKKYEPAHQNRKEIMALFSDDINIVRSPRMFISSFATNL